MPALVIIRLAATFIAVGSIVLTRQAVHHVEVIRAEGAFAVAIFGKITGVGRLSARPSSNLDLIHKCQFIRVF